MSCRVVVAAREWIGTPYRHQAACKGAGCDCLGLLCGLWRELVGPLPVAIGPYTPDWAEPQGDEVLLRTATALLRPADPAQSAPSDIVLFRMRRGSVAKHVGLLAEVGAQPTFIHSYSGHGVVESPLAPPWARRIVARFQFPERDS